MKRILLICVACTALLWSCAKDDILSVDRSMVTFSLTSSDDATRAYGNGLQVKDLRYAIYAEEDYSRPLVERTCTGIFSGSLTTTIKEELIAGNRYTILFWADSDAESATYINNTRARYIIDWGSCTVTLNTDNLTANNEDYDAFFAKVDFTASINGNVPVVLRRPFAQLNITANDYQFATHNNIDITQTALSIEAYTQLNLWSGKVEENSKKIIEFAAADLPTTAATEQDRHLSMNYILVGDEEFSASPTISVFYTSGGVAKSFLATYADVTLKRNSRTNIVGNIITSNLAGQNNETN